MSQRQILDDAALMRLYRIGGNPFVVEMIDLFLENAPRRIESAREAYDGQDLTTLHRSVHSLKSTAANLGASALRATAEAAEARASEGDMDALPPLLEDLERQYEDARDALTEERLQRDAAGGTNEEPS